MYNFYYKYAELYHNCVDVAAFFTPYSIGTARIMFGVASSWHAAIPNIDFKELLHNNNKND